MTDIKSMTPEEIAAALKDLGQPSYRAGQIFRRLQQGTRSFGEMSELPLLLRDRLGESFYITVPEVVRRQSDPTDGTVKYLWRLRDGNCIETVLMRYKHGNTVCVSSQVGCRMGCAFCASATGRLETGSLSLGDFGPGAVYSVRLWASCFQYRSYGHWGASGQFRFGAPLLGIGSIIPTE